MGVDPPQDPARSLEYIDEHLDGLTDILSAMSERMERAVAALGMIAENGKPTELLSSVYIQGAEPVRMEEPDPVPVHLSNGRGLETVIFRLHCRCGAHVLNPSPTCEWCGSRVLRAVEVRRSLGGIEEGFDLRD